MNWIQVRPMQGIVDVEHTNRHIEGLRFVFVELPKFKPQSIAEKKMAVLWLRFLTEIAEDTIEAPAELMENEATRKALALAGLPRDQGDRSRDSIMDLSPRSLVS